MTHKVQVKPPNRDTLRNDNNKLQLIHLTVQVTRVVTWYSAQTSGTLGTYGFGTAGNSGTGIPGTLGISGITGTSGIGTCGFGSVGSGGNSGCGSGGSGNGKLGSIGGNGNVDCSRLRAPSTLVSLVIDERVTSTNGKRNDQNLIEAIFLELADDKSFWIK